MQAFRKAARRRYGPYRQWSRFNSYRGWSIPRLGHFLGCVCVCLLFFEWLCIWCVFYFLLCLERIIKMMMMMIFTGRLFKSNIFLPVWFWYLYMRKTLQLKVRVQRTRTSVASTKLDIRMTVGQNCTAKIEFRSANRCRNTDTNLHGYFYWNTLYMSKIIYRNAHESLEHSTKTNTEKKQQARKSSITHIASK